MTGKTSFMKLIKNSDQFRARFQRNCTNVETNPTTAKSITDIASSKHRFDSHSRPFGRGCIYFQALLVTAQQILDEHGASDGPGSRSLEFLEFMDTERALSFAMMADAGDEVLQLVRFLESEQFDKTSLAPQLDEFMHRIQVLFTHGQCVKTGYTKHMLTVLSKSVTVFLKKHEPKNIGHNGPVPEDMIRRCLLRLQRWVSLALTVLRAEFPNFEVLQTFQAFELARSSVQRSHDEDR